MAYGASMSEPLCSYRHARWGAVKATVLAGDAGPTLADSAAF